MRIDTYNKVSELYRANSVKNTAKPKKGSFRDQLEISQTGKGYQVAKQIMAQTPDIREAKVQDIKQRMEAGNYNVSINDVADKLVDHYFDQLT